MSNVVRGDELGIAAASAIHSPGRGSRARNARKARHGRLPALPRFRGAVVAATGKRAANGPIEAQGTAPAPTGAAVVNAACAFEREAVNAGSRRAAAIHSSSGRGASASYSREARRFPRRRDRRPRVTMRRSWSNKQAVKVAIEANVDVPAHS